MHDNDKKDWVDTIADWAAALGLNRVRVRWKLDRLRRKLQESVVQTRGRVAHVGYENKVCPHCHSVNDKEARTCARCARPLSTRPLQIFERLGILSPNWWSTSTVLGVAMVIIYARLMIYAGGGFDSIFTMDTAVLLRFGGGYSGAYHNGEWWRLITSVFLHAGLWHLGFNLFALSQLGPFVEEIFGRAKMVIYFVLTGIVASLGSVLTRAIIAQLSGEFSDVSVSIGASGALMGLVGIMAGWGQREGTSMGRGARNLAFKWALYTMVFGWFIGADNGAHGAGFIAGGIIGLLVRPERSRGRSLSPVVAVGALLSGLVAAGGIIACLLPIPSPLADPFDKMISHWRGEPVVLTQEDNICHHFHVGDVAQTKILLYAGWSPNILATEAEMDAFVASLCAREPDKPSMQ